MLPSRVCPGRLPTAPASKGTASLVSWVPSAADGVGSWLLLIRGTAFLFSVGGQFLSFPAPSAASQKQFLSFFFFFFKESKLSGMRKEKAIIM